jgi:predicted nucleotidyltransferase
MSASLPLEPVSDEFIAGIVSRQLEENERYEIERLRRLADAIGEARRLAEVLSHCEGVRRVLLFGSAVSGRFFRVDSDIDLAIEGGDVLKAMALVEDSSFHVDLVDMEAVHASIRERILVEGQVLYEAN